MGPEGCLLSGYSSGKSRSLEAGDQVCSRGQVKISSEEKTSPIEVLQLRVGRFPYASVIALQGKVFWRSGAKKYHKVAPHNKPHIRDLCRGTQEDGRLCLGKKQQQTGRNQALYTVWGQSFPEWD